MLGTSTEPVFAPSDRLNSVMVEAISSETQTPEPDGVQGDALGIAAQGQGGDAGVDKPDLIPPGVEAAEV